jgi:hypothetical protein
MINKLFNLLDEWRKYPNYQLERRADIFFAIHLEALLKSILGVTVRAIIPEFPIRIGSIYSNIPINKSYKVDYAVFTADNKVVLVELKTDDGSTREEQDAYYDKSIEVGFPKIMQGLLDISDATEYKSKCKTLIDKLRDIGAVERKSEHDAPTMKFTFYPQPVFIKPNRK